MVMLVFIIMGISLAIKSELFSVFKFHALTQFYHNLVNNHIDTIKHLHTYIFIITILLR
jgi:hypothetical protein